MKIQNPLSLLHLCLAGLILLVAACSKPTALSNSFSIGQRDETSAGSSGSDSARQPVSFENTSNEIHFESVDDSGSFTHHQVLIDPLRGQYERGKWAASLRSRSFQVNPEKMSAQLPYKEPETQSEPKPEFEILATSPVRKNRVNLSFVGDGYAARDIPMYRSDVSSIITQLKTQEPFLTYADYFNFNRVDVVSGDSGVSQDPKGTSRNTALGMSYYCGGIDRLLCGNLNKIMAEAQNAGSVDAVFALANSETYGGAGYTDPPVATFAGRNPGSLELALHEFGHSFGLLADEYSDAGTANSCLNYENIALNTAQEITQKKIKWYRWMGVAGIGAFEGACYQTKGFFRPTDNSKMRALDQPFGAINVEQFILQLYKKVSPIEKATSEGTYSSNQIFKIQPMHPIGHSLKIVWTLDGKAMPKYNGVWSLNSKKLGLEGAHSLDATVTDPTDQVRDEDGRRSLLTKSRHYKLALPAVVLKI